MRFPHLLAATLFMMGCEADSEINATDDTAGPVDTAVTVPTDAQIYSFTSHFEDASSVSYSSQIFRQVLIHDLKEHIGGMTERIDSGTWFPVSGDVTVELEFYFDFDDATSSDVPHLVETTPSPSQRVYGDIAAGKNLVDKIAGNDATGQHQDWSTEFIGWTDPKVTTPESLVRHWFSEIDIAAVARSNGDIGLAPDGMPLESVAVTADGLDRAQLLQKFLMGAVSFSQAADDYLDDDIVGKGLLADDTSPVEDKPYTSLEHAWDEAFGYFGASVDYGLRTTELIAGDHTSDTVTIDGQIDLISEYDWGHSQNAAKRDLGAVEPTQFVTDAWTGFLEGRSLLASSDEPLTTSEFASLKGYRDLALTGWEQAIAATVVHYINDTIQDMDAIGTDEYSFSDHAKHWSELKGFSLSMQFNPRSALSDKDFEILQDLIGMGPELSDDSDALDAYRANLLTARDLIGNAYAFDGANLGDEDGKNGW